ncbi:MAG TPA: hypothetical protein VN721_00465, partial [Flavipsychrobacter sp.]|nr:hypothetical protein [Flavipsychrobacter sp.]
NKSVINQFIQLKKSGGSVSSAQFPSIYDWPAVGNTSNIKGASGSPINLIPGRTYAPFVDVNGDNKYNPADGDYPDINGDQYLWWVFNDAGNNKLQSQTAAIGLEVQANSFAYSTNDALNDATFIDYKIYNRGPIELDSAYMAVWDDADLGWAFDDYIGCDTSRGLGIDYNGKTFDGSGQAGTYGAVIPIIGLDFFKGPINTTTTSGGQVINKQLKMTNFTYYNNDFSQIGNPSNGQQIYGYMTGSIITGQRFSDDFKGAGQVSVGYGSGPISNFVYTGDPVPKDGQWSECTCGDNPADRRFILSSGPFSLLPGAFQDITVGAVWAPNVGGCPKTTFTDIQAADDLAQALFDNNFKTIEGPEAPRLVVRELNNKLVFYMINDYGSNNYKEQYGNVDSPQYRVPSVKAKQVNSPDSLYKFEGYRVFQLANSTVTPAQIYGADGQVNKALAQEVFECDIQNGIKQITNYVKRTDISDSTFQGQVKVNGRDSGIVHSFEISSDAFSTSSNKNLVNYQNYYFVAIAYSYNNFAPFDDKNPSRTQDQPYLESVHGEGGTSVQVVTAMPNPANGAMGTVLNSDYGSGLIIQRIKGTGNGGNSIELTQGSEDTAIMNYDGNYVAQKASYQAGQGPIDVKVIDPVKVVPMDWTLYINGANYAPDGANTSRGIMPASGSWTLKGVGENGALPVVIYSEQNLSVLNEQILEDYGLSVTIKQTLRPGDNNQSNNNGYIGSDISFQNPADPWLAGVQSIDGVDPRNWLRSGNDQSDTNYLCKYTDANGLDTLAIYFNLLPNYSFTKTTWGPYNLVAPWDNPKNLQCGMDMAPKGAQLKTLVNLPSVDVVFTSDTSKWTHCIVIEQQENPALAEGNVPKFHIRSHRSWNKELDGNGQPVYSSDPTDTGMSWFPGYAINEETGERLDIVFGEDSWLKQENGEDMIWNPTSTILNPSTGDPVYGGKHYIYVSGTRYDEDASLQSLIGNKSDIFSFDAGYKTFQWVGVPTINPNSKLLPLSQGLIPNVTRVRLRVTRPYATYNPLVSQSAAQPEPANDSFNPVYMFSTKDLAPTPVSDATNKSALLNRINVVPNPYYGYTGYEINRLDTRVRIINLPANATINIYSLDGTLIRTLTKADPSTSYIDWDIRNNSGLPVASGMYLMDVKADGIGETVLKWFGAVRPLDLTSY